MSLNFDHWRFPLDRSPGALRHSVPPALPTRRRANYVARPHASGALEAWPWPVKRRSRGYQRRVRLVVLAAATSTLAAVILVAVAMQRQEEAPQSPRLNMSAAPLVVSPPVASGAVPADVDIFVIRLRALRPSQVRVSVDGMALEWRALHENEEILARPLQDVLIQGFDGDALLVTVNGVPVSVQPGAAKFRLTIGDRFTKPIVEP